MKLLILLSLLISNLSLGATTFGSWSPWGDVHWKAPVANAAALPSSGNSPGDVRTDLSVFGEYIWNGSSWITISGGSGASPYAVLAGQSGGQNLHGGTAASENLTLDSTSNATKGNILANLSGGHFLIGTSSLASTSPTLQMNAFDASAPLWSSNKVYGTILTDNSTDNTSSAIVGHAFIENPTNPGASSVYTGLVGYAYSTANASNALEYRGYFGEGDISNGATASNVIGFQGGAAVRSGSSTPNAYGVYAIPFATGVGSSITSADGVLSQVSSQSSASITTAKAIETLITTSGGATIGTGYGVYIGNNSATTPWGLYEAATSPNYFAGPVGLQTNTLNTGTALTVNPTTTTDIISTNPDGIYATSSPTVLSGTHIGSAFVMKPTGTAGSLFTGSMKALMGYSILDGFTNTSNTILPRGLEGVSEVLNGGYTTNEVEGLFGFGLASGAGSFASTVTGARTVADVDSGATATNVYGFNAVPQILSPSSASRVAGVRSQIFNSGTVTDAIGVFIDTYSGGGTFTNKWSLYAADATQRLYSQGRVLIGSSTDDTSNALQVTGSEKITSTIASYDGDTTAGNGVSSVVAQVALTGQTGAIGTTTLYTPTSNGLFRISCYMATTTTGSGNAQMTVTYTDDSQAQSNFLCTLPTSSKATPSSQSTYIEALNTIPIQYTVSYTAGTGTYSLYMTVERLK